MDSESSIMLYKTYCDLNMLTVQETGDLEVGTGRPATGVSWCDGSNKKNIWTMLNKEL